MPKGIPNVKPVGLSVEPASVADIVGVEEKRSLQDLIGDPNVDPNLLGQALLDAQHPNIGQMQQRLPFVGDKAGWRRYWVLTSNVPFRLSQGWRFVKRDAIQMVSTGIEFGNKALGDNVEVPAGRADIDENGKSSKLHLMEIPEVVALALTKANVTDPTRAIEAAIRGDQGAGAHISPGHNPYAAKTFRPGMDAMVKSSL